jgi:predicted metal-dependent hydrolase
MPRKVRLTAMKKQWKITYIHSPGKLILIEHPHHELGIYGKKFPKLATLKLITRWVRLKSHDYLIATLHKMNRKVKANYKKIIIRSHEAQWGSYSSNKTISLNYKLIFLPTALVKHVIYHELCHVRHPNHSERFWREVGKYDKNWKKNRKALDDAYDHIPEWVVF